jgi:serine protease Do
MELREASGVLVTDVISDGPADRCGLRARDVIVKVDGTPVEHSKDLVDLLSKRSAGDEVAIQVRRGADSVDMTAVLSASPSPEHGRPSLSDRERGAEGDRFGPLHRAAFGPQIGVDVFPLNADLARAVGAAEAEGLLVLRVRENSPAAAAGLRAGDVIVRMNDREVRESSDIREALRSPIAGEKWKAEVIRDRRTTVIEGGTDPAWRLPRPGEPLRAPRLRDRGDMSVWANRQWRRLDREVKDLRTRLEELERRARGRDDR